MTEYVEQKGTDIENWRPTNKGEMIEGQVVDISKGQFGKEYLIENADGSKCWRTPAHGQLKYKMRGVKEGQIVRLTFDGEVANIDPDKNPTKQYIVEIAK